MESDLYTVRVESDVAGMVVRSSSAALESSLPTMSLYDDKGTYIAVSEQGKVHMVAATEPAAYGATRVLVGIRDHEQKTLTLLPAAGEQVVRLRPRLADRIYDAPEKDEEVKDNSRRQRTTELVQAFGSRRRAKQLGQRQVTAAVEGNVMGRELVEAEIAALGNQAEAAGLTTQQVMSKLASVRNIPVHNLTAMSAAEAYKLSDIVTASDLQHLNASRLDEALKSSSNLHQLQHNDLWQSLDQLVRHTLRNKNGKLLPSAQTECSQWLALYHVCRKMMRLRPGSVLNEAVAPLEGSTKEGVDDGEDADPFASGQRVTDLQDFARRFGLVSPAAVVHFAERFGSLRAHEQGMVFQMSDSEKQLLNTTLAVCVVRSNENRVTPDMGRALLKALNPTPPAEVTAWFKEIGCVVTAVKQHPEGAAFSAQLLTSVKRAKPLCDALPVIKARKRKRAN